MEERVTLLPGSSVNISCRATTDANYATLSLSYRWERSGMIVAVPSNRFLMIGSFGDLQIIEVQSADAGAYTCIALTSDSSLMSAYHLETVIGSTAIHIASKEYHTLYGTMSV